MNGDEALRQIRKEEGLNETKVVGISAAVADRKQTDAFGAEIGNWLSEWEF